MIELSPGYLKLKESSPYDEFPSKVSVENWSLSLGGGVQMNFFDRLLVITPRFKVGYSKTEYDFDIEGLDNAVIDALIPDVNSWSYIPSIDSEIYLDLSGDGEGIILGSNISYLYVDAEPSNSNIDDFTSDSWFIRNSIGYQVPLGGVDELGVFILHPSISRVDFHGSARDGFGFNNFYEYGIELFRRGETFDIFSQFGFGITYIHEDEVEGWRVGLQAKFG